MFMVTRFAMPVNEVESTKKTFELGTIVALFVIPFTIKGFGTFILNPVAEEILFRGVLYGYLRKKVNYVIAIFIQTIITSVLHVYYDNNTFSVSFYFIGLGNLMFGSIILAYLYETTRSLYSSMICHGMYNFLVYMYPVFF